MHVHELIYHTLRKDSLLLEEPLPLRLRREGDCSSPVLTVDKVAISPCSKQEPKPDIHRNHLRLICAWYSASATITAYLIPD